MDYGESLSNIELYFADVNNFFDGKIYLSGDNYYHATRVMRHSEGDIIFITSGNGEIFKCLIIAVEKERLVLKEIDKFLQKNKYEKIHFCLPRLKNSDRFEFALEKSVELGITNFIIYDADHAVAKGNKSDRWEKISIAAMKQSLRCFKPDINYIGRLSEVLKLVGDKIIFEQNSSVFFKEDIINFERENYFIFGPEGGLSKSELDLFFDFEKYKLGNNRLRSETAIIVCASLLNR